MDLPSTIQRDWKVIIAIALVSAFIGGLAGASITRLWRDSDSTLAVGQVVSVGGPATLPDIQRTPFCNDVHRFCIVEPQPGQFFALYAYDTNDSFRQLGCSVHWTTTLVRTDPTTQEDRTGWFLADCSGSVFDMSGHRVFGPAPRDLDRFALQQRDGNFFVDTRTLTCGGNGLTPVAASCVRAPPPQ